ncbi:MAG TPA: GNVR domain-containing protein [Thermoanaerobaculia bacterium]|nr:GNVR domain-containing protein [Thermoanaerobaculia bacterium]
MKNLTLSELGKSLWRRPAWFLGPLVLGVAGALVALQVLPPTYQATTQVLVEPQKVPADYVKPTVTTSMDERLRTIEPQIKNRENIERIIREMNLYPELRREWSVDRLVDQTRKDLLVRLQGDTFFITFKGEEPAKVAATANRIAELFIEQNLKLRKDQAQGTSSFLEAELAATKKRLELQEARIAAIKQVHMGELPEQRDTNLRQIEQLQSKLEINMDALDRAETRKLVLQREMADVRYPEYRARRSSSGAVVPAPPSRLDQLKDELAELRARYTDRHPDVIRKREEIARMEEIERERPPAPAPAAGDEVEVSEAPPTPQVDPILRGQLQEVEGEIRSLKAERQRILSDIGMVQARLESTPRVEQDLLSLTRDYDNIQRSYDSLLDKRINARLAENLEERQQSEQFTILERAITPKAPSGPNQLLVLAVGLAVGCLLGTTSALLRDRTDPTYTDAETLQESFPGVPLLATIPVMSGAAGLRRK